MILALKASASMLLLQQRMAVCNNNCRGVDPNTIVGAGAAVVALSSVAATGFLPFLAATGALAAGGDIKQ